MNERRIKNHTFSGFLLPFLLVCLFALCTLLTAAFGLKTYYNLKDDTDRAYNSRTAVSYLVTKLRQSPGKHAVTADGSILRIEETMENTVYETRIYLENGVLKESFSEK